VLRGQRVLLDSHLSALYGVTTKRLNEQVRRNAERFPEGFMFRLTTAETTGLRSQFATSNWSASRGGRRYLPYAITDDMSIYVVRAFLRLRELLVSNRELSRRFAQLEARLDKKLTYHDEAIAAILSAIRQLMNPPATRRRPIGFTANLDDTK
jgi:hypothetical protein